MSKYMYKPYWTSIRFEHISHIRTNNLSGWVPVRLCPAITKSDMANKIQILPYPFQNTWVRKRSNLQIICLVRGITHLSGLEPLPSRIHVEYASTVATVLIQPTDSDPLHCTRTGQSLCEDVTGITKHIHACGNVRVSRIRICNLYFAHQPYK